MSTEQQSTLAIDMHTFREIEITGKVEDVRDYTTDAKRAVNFYYSRGGSIHTNAFLYNDTLYFGACDCIVYGINLQGKKTFEFKCPDIPFHPTVQNDTVYFGCYDGNLYAVNLSGKMLWKFPTAGKVVTTPIISNGTVYFGSEDKNLYAVTTDGKLLWKFPTMDVIAADAFIYENLVLFGSGDGNLYAVDKTNGNLLWKFATRAMVCSPVTHGKKIYVGSYDQNFYALTLKGREIWRFTLNRPVSNKRPEIYNNVIYLGSNQTNNFYALTPEGKLLWKFPMSTYIFIKPAAYNNTIYFGNLEGRFFALDAKTGKKLWESKVGIAPLISNPIVHDNRIYFGSWDCNFFCLDLRGKPVWKFPTNSSAMSTIEIPERIEKGVLENILKPAELTKEGPYTATFSGEVSESIYTFNTGYKTKSEYAPSKRYRQS